MEESQRKNFLHSIIHLRSPSKQEVSQTKPEVSQMELMDLIFIGQETGTIQPVYDFPFWEDIDTCPYCEEIDWDLDGLRRERGVYSLHSGAYISRENPKTTEEISQEVQRLSRIFKLYTKDELESLACYLSSRRREQRDFGLTGQALIEGAAERLLWPINRCSGLDLVRRTLEAFAA